MGEKNSDKGDFMESRRLFNLRLALVLGVELLAIQTGMFLNRYSLMEGIGWVGLFSWFLIGGALVGGIAFGALLTEWLPERTDGRPPGFFEKILPQLPWAFALLVALIDSYFYFPRM
jgi:hypothetical protein